KDYFDTYSSLRKYVEKVSKLQLLALLSAGLDVIQKDIVKEDFCPLCQQEKDKIKLAQELSQRVEDLKEIKTEQDKLIEECEEIKKQLRITYNSVTSLLKEKFISDEENESLKTKVEVIQKGLV